MLKNSEKIILNCIENNIIMYNSNIAKNIFIEYSKSNIIK